MQRTQQQTTPDMETIQPYIGARLPNWITYWCIIASILVTFDCIYVIGVAFHLRNYIPSYILQLWTWYGESDSQYSSDGIVDSNGWILTQSIFNVFEVLAQLMYVFVLESASVKALLVIMLSSMATLWKTLIYMSIIATSDDPVLMVPGLACLGYEPKTANAATVAAHLAKDDCFVQFFKFQFNFWWILIPFLVIITCANRIVQVFQLSEKNRLKAA
jgi:hypothetical protein